jgi:hypothetical protein
MANKKELLTPADKEAGRITFLITQAFVGVALNMVDSGKSTDQIRKIFKIEPEIPSKGIK